MGRVSPAVIRPTAALGLTFVVRALALASPAAAQAVGLPLRNPGGVQGISLGVDFGLGRIDRPAPGRADHSRAIGFTAAVGFGPVGVSLGVARTTIDRAAGADPTGNTLTATAQLSVLGGPLIPLSVVWFGAMSRSLENGSPEPWRGSAGIGLALTIPAAVASIKPWLAPRLDYFGRQPVQGTRIKGAVSGGIDLGLLNGLGLRVGYDSRLGWADQTEPATGISVGLSVRFR